MNIKELRNKNIQELNVMLLDLLKEQFNLRMQKTTNQLNQTHLLKFVRRDIARVKTVLSEVVLIGK